MLEHRFRAHDRTRSSEDAFAIGHATRLKQIESVRELMRTFERALKGACLYPTGSRVVRELEREFAKRLFAYLDRHHTLGLTVVCDEIYFEDELVFDGSRDERNFAFTLFDGGVKELVFHTGLDANELTAFIDVVRSGMRADDFNIATALWELELRHVAFVTVDLVADETDVVASDLDSEDIELRDRIRDRTLELNQIASMRSRAGEGLETLEEDAFSLRDDEIDALSARVHVLAAEPVLSEACELFWSMLEQAEKADEQTTLLLAIHDLLPLLADHGDLSRFIGSLANAQRLMSNPRLDPAVRNACHQLLLNACARETVRTVAQSIGHLSSNDALSSYVRALGAYSILAVGALLGDELPSEELLTTLGEIYAGQETALRPYMSCDDATTAWTAIRVAAHVLGDRAQNDLIRATDHVSPRVRAEAVRTLAHVGNLRGLRHVIATLDDRNRTVRAHALTGLMTRLQRPIPELLPDLLALAGQPQFERRSDTERQTLFCVVAAADPENGIAWLVRLLTRRSWWVGRKRIQQTALLVIAALESCGNDAAYHALEQHAPRLPRRTRVAAFAALERLKEKRRTQAAFRETKTVRIQRPNTRIETWRHLRAELSNA